MIKYWVLLFVVAAAVLVYIFLQDPCAEGFRTDFSDRYPTYKILDFAGEGDTEGVSCHMFYKKPDDAQIYEDIWTYVNSDDGWQFSEIKETRKRDAVSRDF